jgi:hypothetical protein
VRALAKDLLLYRGDIWTLTVDFGEARLRGEDMIGNILGNSEESKKDGNQRSSLLAACLFCVYARFFHKS